MTPFFLLQQITSRIVAAAGAGQPLANVVKQAYEKLATRAEGIGLSICAPTPVCPHRGRDFVKQQAETRCDAPGK